MYKTSEKFKNAVYGDSRTFLAKVSDGTHSASEEILSLKQTSRSASDDCVSIGGAVSSYIEIKMWDPGFFLDGTEFEISIGMVIDSEPEWVPLGLFTAQKSKSDNGVVTFTAYDRIQTRMSGEFVSDLTYPCDGKAVLAEMSQKTGVPINTANLPDGVMIPKRAVSTDSIVAESGNPVTDTKYVTPFDGYTYREALSYIAQFYGMFATMDRAGNVVFRWYTVADCSISADRYYDDLTLGESVFTVEKIICQAGNDTLSAGEGTACIQLENPVMTQERLTAVHQQIKSLEFLPASVSFLGDPRIDVGDIIAVTDKNGNVVKIPVMSLVQDYDGGLLSEVQSFGRVESESSQNKGPTDQKLDRLYKDLFLVKELVGEKASFGYVYSVSAKVRKLETETITADRIDVNGIFAQDITATGTITGAVLKGASGQFTGTVDAQTLYVKDKIQIYASSYNSAVTILEETKEDDINNLILGSYSYGSIFSRNPISAPNIYVDRDATIPTLIITDRIEISQATPYIDFHWGNTDTDYTSRIIENDRNVLNINGACFTLGGAVQCASLTANGGISAGNGRIDCINSGSNEAQVHARNDVRDVYLCASSSGRAGIYDSKHGWIIRNESDCVTTYINTCMIKNGKITAAASSTSWLAGASPGGASYDSICTDAGALVPVWRCRSADGAWVGASYAYDPGFRIYYANNARLNKQSDNGTDARFTFGASGVFYATSIKETSDEQRKDIKSGITADYADLFMALKPILFSWKENPDGIHMGFGAQSVFHQAEACGIKDFAAVHQGVGDEPWSIAYSEFVPLLVQMVQKLTKEVQELKESR